MPTPTDLNNVLSAQRARQVRTDTAWHEKERQRVRGLLPLPLASEVGLQEAYTALRSWPWARQFDWPPDLVGDPTMLAAAGLWQAHGGNRRSMFWADHPLDREHTLPPPDGVSSLVVAVTAAEQRGVWRARRQVENTPQARKAARTWSRLYDEHHIEAVRVADRIAAAVNGAAQGVTTTSIPTRKVVPSWH